MKKRRKQRDPLYGFLKCKTAKEFDMKLKALHDFYYPPSFDEMLWKPSESIWVKSVKQSPYSG